MSLRILFLYNADWTREIDDVARGKVPSHRLFGLSELKLLGYQAFACPAPASIRLALKRPALWRVYQAIFARLQQQQIDCIVATHEAAALPVLLLKRLGFLRTPIVILSVALLHPRNMRGVRGKLWRWALPTADTVICYASAQVDWLVAEFALAAERVAFVPFGVDVDYFPRTEPKPHRAPADSDVISVGANEGKDFPTLLAALPGGVRMTIVTDDYNANQIAKTHNAAVMVGRVRVFKAVPIDRLRSLYDEAAFHVIPLLETRFSSGQTVLLENMAMGRVVIVTDTSATRDYALHDVTALTVRPGDVEQLRQRIEALLKDPERFRCVGEGAAARVRECFSARRTARRIADLIERLVKV